MVKGIENIATKEDVLNSTNRLIQHIRKCHSDTIKWMFIFWRGQVAAISAGLILYLKK